MTTIRARFTTPTITATPAALEVLAMADLSPATILARHFAGEGGGQPDNAARNEEYLASGEGMLLSVFADVPGGPLWVISHIGCGDDEYTTLLLPAEY